MMKKKLTLLLIAVFVFTANAFCQFEPKQPIGTPQTNPNYEHDRFTEMYIDSRDEVVTEQHLQILRYRALKMHIPEDRMMRNKFIFQVLENKKLNLNDRIWAADFLYKAAQVDNSYPLEYIQTMQATLPLQQK